MSFVLFVYCLLLEWPVNHICVGMCSCIRNWTPAVAVRVPNPFKLKIKDKDLIVKCVVTSRSGLIASDKMPLSIYLIYKRIMINAFSVINGTRIYFSYEILL